ncbi:Na+-translocating ferredoxin:NAD+ oxidoreductase RNF, RnfC subunit [Caldanaerovirga acetigignens]|uniref:Na+-translocating ferredoxin:NAD+ oxidoreductase RNF, RnfC subunit n=1 Tax=Caldanaerovirga acetigignens TaxID=447595 RepID=A0A1M7MC46_9FIRM|nr:4Fe-4S dicluster domain-containing protein [Caldanaerovirga acetigignens]SHM88313.1 Na+-translocating ferredoxin:NAD+ oxidoreductase RNF, RnfC subunit [Caldanaerovirga acetigignens]
MIDSNEIIEQVRNAGVVGAGGAGFPAHIKLNNKCDVVIANFAECEPLLFTNQALVMAKVDEVLEGLQLAMKATGAKMGIIALKKKYSDCKRVLSDKLKDYDNMEIFELGDFYPAGDEHVIVREVLGRKIPMAGIPLDVGAVVHNVETLYNIKKAYSDKLPVTEKFVTVGGAVKYPLVLNVPVGMKFSELLDLAGGPTAKDFILIDGGPMMGKEVGLDDVVTKTTSALLVVPINTLPYSSRRIKIDVQLKRARTACCQCRICTDLCPRYLLGHKLEPHKIMRAISFGLMDAESLINSLLCSECGLCEVTCPMGLSPRNINASLKKMLFEKKVRFNKTLVETERPEREIRKFSAKKLLVRLGLSDYYRHIDYTDKKIKAKEVKLLLKQHAGSPAIPVVKVGDKVNKNDVVAKIQEGQLGANIHASIDGTVVKIDETSIVVKSE